MSINDYIALGWGKPIIDTITIIVSVAVLVGCICRVNMLGREHKPSWKLLYVMVAAFSAGLAIDVGTFASVAPSWYAVVGTLAAALHFWTTWPMWRHEPPIYTRKDFKHD